MAKLSRRETEVARLVTEGWPNVLIAARLGLQQRSVAKYLRSACRKLQVRHDAELARHLVEAIATASAESQRAETAGRQRLLRAPRQ